MRKVTLIAVLLAAVGLVAGFAQATPPQTPTFSAENTKVAITGDASVFFGVDLDTMATGFTNEANAALTLTLIPATTVERTGAGPVYGYIQLTDLTIAETNLAQTETAPGVTAKLNIGKTYLQISSAPTIEVDLESLIRSFTAGVLSANLLETIYAVSGGVTIGYTGTDASVSLSVGSGTDWTGKAASSEVDVVLLGPGVALDPDTDRLVDTYADGTQVVARRTVTAGVQANTVNAYAAEIEFAIAAENLTLGGNLTGAINYPVAQPLGFGFNFSYTLPLGETFSLVPVFGFDGRMTPPSNVLNWAIGAGLRLKWPGSYGADFEIKGRNQIFAASQTVYSGLTVSVDYSVLAAAATPALGVSVSSWEDSGDAGLLPGIGYAVAFEIANATVTPAMGLKAYLDYTAGNLKPYAGAAYTAPVGATAAAANAMAGLLISNIFANTSLNTYYYSGNLLATDPVLGELVTQLKIAF